ncbi:hypothetical protein TRVA0_026S01420 [Trichomonascus vanleenenianus]|uniref:uncharacterized protein n=1 Tax=Trichomonascus vanleenenianus TaxID=2268995 RepID=UPI003EC999B3
MLRSAAVRAFSTSAIARNATSVPLPKKKVGAFRGGFLGFLLGVTITGYGSYYYLVDEYRAANNVIIADVTSLQSSIKKLEAHVASLESQIKK